VDREERSAGAGLREHALQFGDRKYLLGVVSEPPPETRAPARPAFVFLNAGMLHHVGPSRTYVSIARNLAVRGFYSLRFDLGGLGDSGNRRDTSSFLEGAAREVVTAMDALQEEHGCSTFVLAGLCSGARLAVNVAAADPRVVGLVALDGYMFPTWKSWVNRFRLRRSSILGFITFRLRLAAARRVRPSVDTGERGTSRRSKSEVTRDLQTLVDRGAHQYWLFTGSFHWLYNYRGQHRDTFSQVKFGESLTVDYMPGAAHVLLRLEDQRDVVENVVGWAAERWPAGAPATP